MSGPAGVPRLLAGLAADRPLTLDEHLGLHGPAPLGRDELQLRDVVALLEECALRGRGGAGFPAAAKLSAVARGQRAATVVVNGVEAEPASEKDRTLLGRTPHLVLDGAQIAAAALRASEVSVCVPAAGEWVGAAVSTAVAERTGVLGEVPTQVVSVPDGYVAGEETALVSYLNGGLPLPAFRPPYPFEQGVHRRPTLVNNAETLAHVALIARHGIDWFREIGTSQRPGSTLVTLAGAVSAPGVYEIPYGMPVTQLIAETDGTPSRLQALLVGGCGGTWIAGAAMEGLTFDDESLQQAGASLGPGVVIALTHDDCGVGESVALADYLARASAHQCGPCQFGLAAIAKALAALGTGAAGARDHAHLDRWLYDVHGRGACHHPDGAVRMISTALSVFHDEFAEHAEHGPCEACRLGAGMLTLGRHGLTSLERTA
ncbi:MAG: NADH-ubiquinone oxidoreductase-F iron-sulfur binding region domain-containing protein [Thermoleophilaceae bacterium]